MVRGDGPHIPPTVSLCDLISGDTKHAAQVRTPSASVGVSLPYLFHKSKDFIASIMSQTSKLFSSSGFLSYGKVLPSSPIDIRPLWEHRGIIFRTSLI